MKLGIVILLMFSVILCACDYDTRNYVDVKIENIQDTLEQSVQNENNKNNEDKFDCEVPSGITKKQEGRNYGTSQEITYYSSYTNSNRKASVVLPYNYNPDRKYPVLYLLHGMSGDHTSWLQFNALETVENASYDYNRSDMILVIPNVFTVQDGSSESDYKFSKLTECYDNFENDLIGSLMPYINEHFSVRKDREGTAIAGYSLGGREAVYIGYKYSEYFGYIGGFSPVGGVVTGTGQSSSKALLESLEVKTGLSLPYVFLYVGKSDPYCYKSALAYHSYMNENSIEHTFFEVEGAHEGGVWIDALYNFSRRIF